jgi:hypothetical protein
MYHKEKLIKFVEIKNIIIRGNTNILYIDDRDVDDINSWSDRECERVYTYIVDCINCDKNHDIRSNVCPWCVHHHYNHNYDDECNDCGYGKRHGVCDEANSKYLQLVRTDIFSVLTKNIYIEILEAIELHITYLEAIGM